MNSKLTHVRILLALAGTAAAGCASGLRTGTMAPNFELESLGGESVVLNQYRGDVVLLGFWAVG